jgi:Resolvase, N terminal domain/Recombinase
MLEAGAREMGQLRLGRNWHLPCHATAPLNDKRETRLPFGPLLLRLARGNGGGGGFLRAGRAFLWRHGFKGPLTADLSADLSAPRALLAEVFQNLRRELLLRHESILKRVLADNNIPLYLIGGIRYNQPMKAIGYVRVSTEKQADFGVSLEAQSEKVRAMAVVQGVADSLDTRTAAGRLVLNIMTSVSQWEREAIGERTRDAMRHKRANGERVGTVPFGYRAVADGLHLEADPEEQSVLSRIRELKAAGFTTRRIAGELNQQGFTTRRGTSWRFQYVAEALRAA